MIAHPLGTYLVEVERTVWFLVMFGRFKVRFLAKITCSDMFEVRFWWFWKILGPFFINKVREQFGFWWCSRGSKFGFGPKWDVRMCSKFDPLRFGMFEVRFFDVRSTSNQSHVWLFPKMLQSFALLRARVSNWISIQLILWPKKLIHHMTRANFWCAYDSHLTTLADDTPNN